MAGAEGFEPPLAVLETAGLAVKPMPLHRQVYQLTKDHPLHSAKHSIVCITNREHKLRV
jgi:hypothetical protein